MEITLRVVVRGRQILCEKDMDGERLGKGGNHSLARPGNGVDVIIRQIHSQEKGHTCYIDQDDDDYIDHELEIFPCSPPGHVNSSPP